MFSLLLLSADECSGYCCYLSADECSGYCCYLSADECSGYCCCLSADERSSYCCYLSADECCSHCCCLTVSRITESWDTHINSCFQLSYFAFILTTAFLQYSNLHMTITELYKIYTKTFQCEDNKKANREVGKYVWVCVSVLRHLSKHWLWMHGKTWLLTIRWQVTTPCLVWYHNLKISMSTTNKKTQTTTTKLYQLYIIS